MFVYLADNGLSFTQIGYLFAAQNVIKILSTVPSGVLADRIGRKYCVALSAFSFAAGFLLYGLGTSFGWFLIGCMLQGAAQSFLSGSEEALTYDALDAEGRHKDFSSVFGQKYAYYGYAMAISALAANLIVEIDIRWTFFATSCCLSAAGILALLIREPSRHSNQQCTNLQTQLAVAWSELRRHESAKWLLFYIVLVTLSFQIFMQYLQPLLLEAGFALNEFGYIYAVFTAISGVGAASASFVHNTLGRTRTLLFIYLSMGLGYVGSGIFEGWVYVFLCLAMVQFQNGLVMPALNMYFHDLLNSRHRATIHAFRQLVFCLLLVALFPLFGWIGDHTTHKVALFSLGVMVLVGAAVPLWLSILGAPPPIRQEI